MRNPTNNRISVKTSRLPRGTMFQWKLKDVMTDTILESEGGVSRTQTDAKKAGIARATQLAASMLSQRELRDKLRAEIPSIGYADCMNGVLK